MQENEDIGVGLSTIMKLTGFLPIMIGTTFLLSPRTAIAVGPELTEYGIFVSKYVAVLAIFIGLAQWVVSVYVKENLHIFGRFFALGFVATICLEIYGWTTNLMEFELKFLFATLIPVSAALVLILYSINPEETETVADKKD